MEEKRPRVRRVLLAATVGLATVTLSGCGSMTSGNLMAPPQDAGVDTGATDAGTDAGATDAGPTPDTGTGP